MSTIKTIETKPLKEGAKNTYIKDENGYYKVRLGKINAFNRQGIYYYVDDLDKVTGPGSVLYRRLEEGFLRAEVSHPEAIRKAKTTQELIRAIMFIDLNNVCGHIKRIEFIDTGKPEKGFTRNIIEVYGWVKPSGPKKQILQDALENPDENVAFSIRSLVKNGIMGNVLTKQILEISTWDYVYEPGVKGSSKWGAAGLEDLSLDVSDIDIDDVKELEAGLEEQCVGPECLIKMVRSKMKSNKTLDWLLGK